MSSASAFERALLEWFDRRRREFPWRDTRDPWRVLVSELMLQQTQADRVVPKFNDFVATWPTATACANASAGAVVAAWKGLGYNRRAINLHRAAVAIVSDHGGRVPDSLEDLMALPGIGPYTARAVLAFAYEQDVAVVDVNVARVVARLGNQSFRAAEAQAQADALVPAGEGWRWNQAMLDLGATICTARQARCSQCPASSGCAWFGQGTPDPDPAIRAALTTRPQSKFEGSDRQGRGRLVDALRSGPVPLDDLAEAMGWPGEQSRADAVAASVIADGLAVQVDQALHLPS